MKNKYLVVLIIILSVIAIISSPSKKRAAFLDNNIEVISKVDDDLSTEEIKKEEDKTVTVRIKNNNDIITTLDLEDYIIGVVSAEMPAEFNIEALKAQAIAARTYAVKKMENKSSEYDLVTDTRNQVYITDNEMQNKWGNEYLKYYEKIKKAVDDTKGLVMKYNNEVINAYYFAISNGYTENSEYVWGTSRDYLVSVDSSVDKNVKGFLGYREFSKEEFINMLGLTGNTINIGNITKTPSNRVNTIVINGHTFLGKDIRTLLNLRSTDFTIDIKDKVYITTKGYGHGVGMSQYGANELAKNNMTYEEILKYYYKNINIEKISV